MQDFLLENAARKGGNVDYSSPLTVYFIAFKNKRQASIKCIFLNCTKRICDILISCFGITFFVFIFPILFCAIKLDSAGAMFYAQKRIGQYGKVFHIWKLRTMYENAEKSTGAVWSWKNDSRITPIGKILRRLHLDEIPQFFNVLKGDMSIIGPRPERPEFLEQILEIMPYYPLRHCVKPGMTGLAQVQLPYASSLSETAEKLKYDLIYINNFSILLDCKILLRTFAYFFMIYKKIFLRKH